MSTIDYDPVKNSFAKIIRGSATLRRIFYFLLDLFFLRSWHIRRLIFEKGSVFDKQGDWKLLDAGSGFGQYDRYLLETFNNIKIESIDVKEDYLNDNRNFFKQEIDSGRITFKREDLLEYKKEQEFDFILCVDVLEHIEDDVTVIRNMSKSIKTDGYFLMHSPSHYSESDAGGESTFVGEHARTGYSKADIEKKLMEADLLPVKTHYTYGSWGRRAWILSIKWPMLLFNKIGIIAAIPLLFYYAAVLPFCLVMNYIDLFTKNQRGNGIYALARKI